MSAGKGSQLYTHDNGLKRVSFRILPKKDDAIRQCPRGLEEIKRTLQAHVAKGSYLVFDKWLSTKKAVELVGFHHAPPVNHSAGWRNPDTGHHTNDAESENARIKQYCRRLYGKLTIREDDIYQYAYDVNEGLNFVSAMKALAAMNGGAFVSKGLVV